MDLSETTTDPENSSSSKGRFSHYVEKYKSGIGLTLLVLYVLLLSLGTIGEIWEVEWILDLPVFRPPGKF